MKCNPCANGLHEMCNDDGYCDCSCQAPINGPLSIDVSGRAPSPSRPSQPSRSSRETPEHTYYGGYDPRLLVEGSYVSCPDGLYRKLIVFDRAREILVRDPRRTFIRVERGGRVPTLRKSQLP